MMVRYLDYRRIYASLGLNELKEVIGLAIQISQGFFLEISNGNKSASFKVMAWRQRSDNDRMPKLMMLMIEINITLTRKDMLRKLLHT